MILAVITGSLICNIHEVPREAAETELIMLTSKQRAYLRAMANRLDTIFQIGKGGIGENMTEQLGNALEARELIKLRTLDTCEYGPREAAELLAHALNAEVISVTGSKFVLYRESEKHKKIELPS